MNLKALVIRYRKKEEALQAVLTGQESAKLSHQEKISETHKEQEKGETSVFPRSIYFSKTRVTPAC